MCALCDSHEQRIKQFRRALRQPLDSLSRQRIYAGLQDIEATKPKCTLNDLADSKIVDLRLQKVNKALDALSGAEVQSLVQEIEVNLNQISGAPSDPSVSDE